MLHWTAGPSVRALVFDCDGTLADTMPVHYVAWVTELAEHGIAFPEAQFYGLAGMPTVAIIELLAGEQGVPLSPGQPAAISAANEARYVQALDQVRPIPEVVAVAAHYRSALPMGVGSGGESWVVERTLTTIGVFGWMSAVVGSEATERHKPEPDVFLEVARRLGVEPAACAVFEDSDLGLEAARRAGMEPVDIRPWR